MVIAIGITLGLLAIMELFPATPFARHVRKWLIEDLAKAFDAATPPKLLFFGVLAFAAGLATHLSHGQATPVLAQVGAEAAPWFFSFDLLAFVDGATVAMFIGVALRLTAIVYGVRALVSARGRIILRTTVALIARARARRRRRARAMMPRSKGADEDEGRGSPPTWAVADALRGLMATRSSFTAMPGPCALTLSTCSTVRR